MRDHWGEAFVVMPHFLIPGDRASISVSRSPSEKEAERQTDGRENTARSLAKAMHTISSADIFS